ncbi:MAG: hypothetical protein ACREMV_06130 [Gemmatimonadales bacterium]
MRRTPRLWTVAVAGLWLAAGPVGLTLRAIAICRHEAAASPHGRHGHSSVPDNGPCFCSHMTGGAEATPAPALPVAIEPAALPAPVSAVPFPLPSSPFPDFAPTPETPPPNALV